MTDGLANPVELAIPAFIGLVLVEVVLARLGLIRADYELRDAAASLVMGLGYFVIGFAGAVAVAAITAWVWQFRLFDLGYAWWVFAGLLFAEDFCYYWFHRLSHEHRFWWAAHVNHHSSQHLNLSTALRQSWTGTLAGTFVIWLPLAWLGVPPALIVFQKGLSLVYQFWIHTEAIGKLPRPLELIANTPSHHRVHHAINPRYLDRNYAGIFILWDRLFGTFVPEDPAEPCVYGIRRQIGSFNPVRIALHEWLDLIRDVIGAPSPKAAFLYAFGPPGWSADDSRQTSAEIRGDYRREVKESS